MRVSRMVNRGISLIRGSAGAFIKVFLYEVRGPAGAQIKTYILEQDGRPDG
jgi:hypothetical protein